MIQPHGLDDLQPLVHHGSRVDGDFLPHSPGGMLEGVLFFDGFQLGKGLSVERPAGCRENQAMNLAPIPAAHQALENSAMLGIHRHDFRAALFRRRHHQLSGAHQGFLVGKSNAFFRLDGRQGWTEAHHTHNGGDDGLCLVHGGSLNETIHAAANCNTGAGQALFQFVCRLRIHHHAQLGLKFPGLLLDPIHVAVGGQGANLDAQVLRHGKGLPADGAGASQNRYSTSFHTYAFLLQIHKQAGALPQPVIPCYLPSSGSSRISSSTTGAAKITLSNRSSTPPWARKMVP